MNRTILEKFTTWMFRHRTPLVCGFAALTAVMAMFLPAWFAAWSAVGYANERMGANLLIGGGLITAANVLVQLKPARAAAVPS